MRRQDTFHGSMPLLLQDRAGSETSGWRGVLRVQLEGVELKEERSTDLDTFGATWLGLHLHVLAATDGYPQVGTLCRHVRMWTLPLHLRPPAESSSPGPPTTLGRLLQLRRERAAYDGANLKELRGALHALGGVCGDGVRGTYPPLEEVADAFMACKGRQALVVRLDRLSAEDPDVHWFPLGEGWT